MKDYSKYSFNELYDMVNHINQFKYPEMIEEVRGQIAIRKQRGEIPDTIIPNIKLTKRDWILIIKMYLYLIYTSALSLLVAVLVNSIFSDGRFTGIIDYFFSFIAIISILGIVDLLYLRKTKYLKFIIPVYLLSSLITFGLIMGLDKFVFP